MTDNLPASTHDGNRSSIWAVSPRPRLSPPFRRLLWGERETKNPTPRNTRYYSLLAKEAWRNFRELRACELLGIILLGSRVNSSLSRRCSSRRRLRSLARSHSISAPNQLPRACAGLAPP